MRIALPHPFTVGELAAYANLRVFGCADTQIHAIATDSREVCEGDLFVTFKGENFDGHVYIDKAIENGASAIMCEHCDRDKISVAVILCENTQLALGEIGRNYHKAHRCTTVAVTGSVGKTTTKEFIACTLEEKFRVHKNQGNANSEIGLPLTLISAPRDTEICIVEMGMDKLGDIDYLTNIAYPDLAVVTVIGSSHLEFLKTRENICRGKMQIVNGMKKGSEVIVNGDEPLLTQFDYTDYTPVFACLDGEGEYSAKNIIVGEDKTEFDFVCSGASHRMAIPALGRHLVWGALYACIVASKLGLSIEEIRAGLLRFKSIKRRQNIYQVGAITVLDDCYNAAPESMRAAADVLQSLAYSKKLRSVALLGDMRELGDNSHAMHVDIGEYMVKKGVSLLFTFGKNALAYAEGAKKAGLSEECIFSVDDIKDYEKCGEAVLKNISENDILLVKASLSVGADRVIKYISEHIDI